MDIGWFHWGSKNMYFGQCITFHPNTVTWLTYVFSNIRGVHKWVQFAGCSLDLSM